MSASTPFMVPNPYIISLFRIFRCYLSILYKIHFSRARQTSKEHNNLHWNRENSERPKGSGEIVAIRKWDLAWTYEGFWIFIKPIATHSQDCILADPNGSLCNSFFFVCILIKQRFGVSILEWTTFEWMLHRNIGRQPSCINFTYKKQNGCC